MTLIEFIVIALLVFSNVILISIIRFQDEIKKYNKMHQKPLSQLLLDERDKDKEKEQSKINKERKWL